MMKTENTVLQMIAGAARCPEYGRLEYGELTAARTIRRVAEAEFFIAAGHIFFQAGPNPSRKIRDMLKQDRRFRHIRVGVNPPRTGKDYNEKLLCLREQLLIAGRIVFFQQGKELLHRPIF